MIALDSILLRRTYICTKPIVWDGDLYALLQGHSNEVGLNLIKPNLPCKYIQGKCYIFSMFSYPEWSKRDLLYNQYYLLPS